MKRTRHTAEQIIRKLYPAGLLRRSGILPGKLLRPEHRQRAVKVLQERYRAYERFVCRVVRAHRSTQRHGARSSIWRRPSSGIVSGRSQRTTSAGAAEWPTTCCCGWAGL